MGSVDLTPHAAGGVSPGGSLLARLRPSGPVVRGALWAIGLATGLASLAPGLRDEVSGLATILRLVVAWSFIASGLIAWARRPRNRVGPFMVGVGFLYVVPDLLATSGVDPLATLGVLGAVWWVALFAILLASFPAGRIASRVDRFAVACVVIPAVPMQAVWLAFLPAPENALLVHPDAGIADAVDSAQRLVFYAAVAILPAALVRRWWRASPPLRRVLDPVLVGAAAIVLFGVFVYLDKAGAPTDTIENVSRVVLAAVPIVFLAGMLRARLARSAIGDLLVDLREPAPPGALRDALARAVRDPSLALAYWVPEYAGWVGVDGRPTKLPAERDGRVVTLVERRGERIAALVHDDSLREEPELVGAVCAAAGIALENERLQADLRARLAELRGSRARIVEAGDAERRRLERNLHDGAQQRLITLSLDLRMLARRFAPDSEEGRMLIAARDELAASLEELRELAAGIHPAVLADHGLDVALESLAARAPVPVRLEVAVGRRLSEPVEVAAYFLVCEGLANVAKYAAGSAAEVRVAIAGTTLVVEVADDGPGGADPARGSGLRGLADRVEAVGGRLQIVSAPDRGTTVRAEMPCG